MPDKRMKLFSIANAVDLAASLKRRIDGQLAG
jgi:hypothetical protein